MKMMKHVQTWLLITLLALSANGVANAKLASGGINLGSGAHQGISVANALNALGINDVSRMLTPGSPLATKGIDANTLQRTHSLSGKRSAKNVDGIAGSMRKDGFVGDPIDVVEHNGQRFIIDGHHRAAAARRTGTPVNVNVVNDIKGHRSNFNSIDDVLDSAGSVGPDSLKPRRGR